MDKSGLKLELAGFVLATNLVSFSLGMLLVMVNFELVGFLQDVELYLLLVILLGAVWLFYWAMKIIQKTNEVLP